MKIRKATKKDVKKFQELAKKADRYPSYWSKSRFPNFIKNKEQLILLAEEGKKLIGFSGVMKKYPDKRVSKRIDTDKSAYIAWIAVLPEYRKKQVGSKLLNESEKIAKKLGQKRIWLACKKDVIKFYKKNKYNLKGYFMKEYQDKKFKKYFLEKRLR